MLFPTEEVKNYPNHRWIDIASGILHEAEERLHLVELFGERKQDSKGFCGYSVVFSYGDNLFRFITCFNAKTIDMGVLIKFSAQAFAYYQGQSNLFLYQILQQLESPNYLVRCSRIDIAIDFINEDICVTDIYNNFLNHELAIVVMRERMGKIELIPKHYKPKATINDGECETIYFGKRSSPVMLRIYNKKAEQISKKGIRYAEALEYEKWIRFEAEIKKDYAHNLTAKLLNIQDDIDFKELILGFFIQKFYFVNIVNQGYIESDFLKKIIEMKNNKGITLIKCNNSRNMDLQTNLLHLFRTSGTISTLYKINKIWGNNSKSELISAIEEYLKDYYPNQDCVAFLKHYAEEYKALYPTFADYYEKEIYPELFDSK